MHSALVPLVCREFFDDDAVLVIDGGNTAVWTNLYHENRLPGAMLSTFKFGMLGAGIGQALGAKVAFPDRQVYCIVGDGAMGFHPQELETAVRNDLPVVFLVLCDRQWGMVKFGQCMALDAETMVEDRSLPAGRRSTPTSGRSASMPCHLFLFHRHDYVLLDMLACRQKTTIFASCSRSAVSPTAPPGSIAELLRDAAGSLPELGAVVRVRPNGLLSAGPRQREASRISVKS